MIVKCAKQFPNGMQWVYFDGADKVTHEEHDPGQPIAVMEKLEDLTVSNIMNPESKGIAPVKEICMYNKGEITKQILVNNTVYILNDEGKTIERI